MLLRGLGISLGVSLCPIRFPRWFSSDLKLAVVAETIRPGKSISYVFPRAAQFGVPLEVTGKQTHLAR